jgi:hypothetical protein
MSTTAKTRAAYAQGASVVTSKAARTDLASIEGKSEPEGAALVNVSRSSVRLAKNVLKEGTPEQIKAVECDGS